MSDSQLLGQVADILEKTAAYFEHTESQELSRVKAAKDEIAEKLAAKLGDVTGELVDPSLIDKLAELDPDIATLLSKVAGENDAVDAMGYPQETLTKTASRGVSSADDRFLEWIIRS